VRVEGRTFPAASVNPLSKNRLSNYQLQWIELKRMVPDAWQIIKAAFALLLQSSRETV
jgi:hypothetical protein